MMRASLALLAFLVLAGCGSGGSGNPILAEALKELRGRLPGDGDGDGAEAAPARAISRDAIARSGAAAVLARLEGDAVPTTLFAASENGGYVTYVSGFRQAITLRGSQITGTRGLGTDLLSAWSSPNDPLVRPTPPGSWPASVERSFEFPADAPQGRVETYDCRFELGEASELTILGMTHRGVEISEYCSGPYGSFENLHLADLGSGFVWRSLQWVGPDMDLIDLQVVEPFTGRAG